MNKLKVSLIALFLIALALGAFTQRYALACETVQFSGYQQVAAGIFTSPNAEHVQPIVAAILKGRQRVDATFGEMIASPKIVIVHNNSEAAWFGANATASAHYTPLGTCIVLAPKGHNVDVAAHELTHAEIMHRTGWLRHLLEIPVWFNEGIALLVDHRKPLLIDNIKLSQDEVIKVKKLVSSREFFSGKGVHQNYLAARLAVNDIAPETLYEKLAMIKDGVSFDQAFSLNANAVK